jgi:hypothetical protein
MSPHPPSLLMTARQNQLFGFSFNGQRYDFVFIGQPLELEALPRLKPSFSAQDPNVNLELAGGG